MMKAGAGNRFQVPSPADGLARVPGSTELSIGFWRSFFLTAKLQQIPAQQTDSRSELARLSVLDKSIGERQTRVSHVYEFTHASRKHTGRYKPCLQDPIPSIQMFLLDTDSQSNELSALTQARGRNVKTQTNNILRLLPRSLSDT